MEKGDLMLLIDIQIIPAGAFYFKVPSSPNSGGELAIQMYPTNQLPIHDTDMSNGMSLRKLSPKLGYGILFRADLDILYYHPIQMKIVFVLQ